MKATIELADDVFREAKATAARRGIALRRFVEDAVAENLARESRPTKRPSKKEWPGSPANVPSEEIWRIQALIDEQFEKIGTEE